MATKRATAAPQRADFDFDDFLAAGYRVRQVAPVQEQAPTEPGKPSVARRIGDTAVQFGQGAVTGVKMMADVFGANNAVSRGLGDVNQALDGLLSATAQGDKQKVAQIMQEAEGKGWGEQIVAGLKAAGVDPVGLAANALGTTLPTLATLAIPGAGPAAVAARTGAGIALGAGQGVGSVKGQIYDETKRKWLESGATPEQAEAKAQEAAAYGGANTDQIAIGGVLGMGSVLGAERALGKVLHGASKAGPGMLGRVATSTLAETGTEMLQGGQEKYAANLALNRQGFDVDPMSGVIANATLEGAAAAPMGAVAGIPRPAVVAATAVDPAQAAADTIRATEKVPESGALTKAVNAGVEAKAQAVEAGAPVPTQPGSEQTAEAAPEAVDDPVRDQILALPDGARQDALRAYAVVNRTDVAKGVQQYNRKLLDRLLTENAPPPVLGERLTETDMGSMLGGGGMAGRSDPLAGALGMNNEAQANSITNVANVAERRPPMPASDAARMLDEARNRGLDLAVAEHPGGGFVLVPPSWVTPDMAAQGEARLKETIARMQQADAAPVERAPRTRTDGVGLNLQTDPVQNYLDNLRSVNTPAARAYVRDFDAGRITPADVQRRMQAEQGLTPEQRIARAAAEAPAQTDQVADRLARAAAEGMVTPAPTDILNPAGEPFKTKMAADRAAKKSPGAAVLPVVDGGFLVRPKEPVNVQDVPQAPKVPQAAPAISQPSQAQEAVGAQPAGPAAGVPTEGAGAVEATGLKPQLPPTDVRLGDKVSVNGELHTVTGPLKDGKNIIGVVASRDSDTDPAAGVQQVFLRGDDAVRAKLAADAESSDKPSGSARPAAAPAVGAPMDALQNQAGAPAAATQQATDDLLPEGWTKSVNGFTKRPVYRMEQGVGQPFAVVTQTEGMTYEVQIRHGDKQLTTGTQRGALSEVLAAAKAELGRMKQADSVTHADPGEKAEAATPAVVTDSLKKAARNEDTKPSDMRKWLVGKIDEAIAVAPEAAVDFLSFDVPGDGTFKVQNSQARLQEFRKKVMASPGFKDSGQRQNTNPPEQTDSARNGSGSTVEAIRNFLADGDVQGAVEFAKLKGVEFTPVKPRASMTANGKFKRVPASVTSKPPSVAEGLTQVEAEQLNQYLTAERAMAETAAAQDADAKPSPQDFIPAPDGGLDYGEITPEMGKAMRRQAGKIRLQQGDASFGLVHIEQRHGAEIRKAGFESIEAFVSGAVADIESIWRPEATSQLVVIQATERGKVVFIQLQAGKDDSGDFYTVRTAFPSSRTYAEKRKEWKQLWSRVPVPAADAGKSAPSAELGNEAGSKSTMESGQSDAASVPPTTDAAQPDTPKLTPAEAKSLMAWEDLGQKDGVKTNALTFYESQADKDAKRGRMIVAKVSKGDRSATAWMVDGEDKTFGALAQAKKLAEEVGMAKAVADGFVEQAIEAPKSTAKPAATATAGAPITDFGQKIGGARKDVWSGFKDDLNKVEDADIANQPLSKVWPAPDYQKLIDAGMDAKSVAAVRALRDEVPAKPRAAWKVKRWAEQVKTLRGLANDVMDGKITVQDMERMGANKGTSLRGMMGRIELYELVGHAKSLEGVRFAEHHYTLYRGRENVNLWVVEKDAGASAFSNWPREIAVGDTKEQALASFKEKYAGLDLEKAVRKASFDIFSERGSNAFYVGKKIGRNYAKLEGPFNTVREAREYREKNLQALEAKLEKYKEIPRERADVNQPRVGVDMRNGQDVTPQMFGEVFGFRGVEFGNWVEQKRRQKDLNDAFDALMDMAAVLDIPPKAISLNGQLGLAFGARGSGGVNPAAAHYEPDNVVINLTKKEGAGSLGHEWWHALDNYFAKQRKVNRGSFMTTGTDVGLAARGKDYYYEGGIRQEMIDAFGAVVKAINQTAMKARASTLDGKRTKDYWTTGEEMSARAFESYLISKLQDQNASNDYLANVVSEKTWDAMAALGMENENSYPYPTAAEIPAIRAGFDHFFQTVETRETEGGNVAMFSRTPSATPPADSNARNVATQRLVDGLKAKWTRAPEIIVARNMQDEKVPQAVRDHDATLKSQGATGEARGFIYRGKVYLLSDQLKGPQQIAEVLFHEVLGHYGLRGAFGDALTPIFKQIAALRLADVQAKAKEYGLDMANEAQRLQAAEEVLAEMAQTKPDLGYVKRAIAAIRTWLRANVPGFKRLALTDAEIIRSYIIPARGFVERGRAATVAAPEVQGGFEPAFSLGEDAGKKALVEFAKADELFALPKSGKDTVAGIAADIDSKIAVRVTRLPGETMYTLNHPDFGVARITERSGNPYGPSLYGYNQVDGEITDQITERPGENPEDVDPRTGDVWLDVSLLKPGQGGEKVYAIAANYAHNTGQIFIGDPAGLSTVALRRRLEQMLSSALKFGTTAHLAPHPDQVRGGDGVPPLRWVYGDDVGNVERMIAASVKALDNAMPTSKLIAYDPDRGFYRTDTGRSLARGQLAFVLKRSASEYRLAHGAGAAGQAGWRTIARAALFRHLQTTPTDGARQIPERGGLLARAGEDVSRLGRGRDGGEAFGADERIFYSRTAGAGSVAEGPGARIGAAIKAVTATNIKKRAGFKLTDYLGIGLQALGRRQIVDIYGDLVPLAEYNRLVQQMEADKNEGGAEADQLVTRWAELPDEGKLADLMHDATLAQIDPAEDFVDGDDKGKYLELRRKYNLLSDDAKKVYADTRDSYKAHHAKVRSAIKERIERSEIKGERKAALLKQMDDEFFKAVKGVYFPLARFGQYAVTVKGPDGKVESVSRAETKAEAEALRSNLLSAFPRDKGFTVGRVMLSKDFIADRDAVGRGFMTELYQVLDKQDMDATQRAELEDTLGQLYLSSLPDLSWAKHGIHRKGTPGFSQDARRAFAQNMFHGARYLAKLRYSDLMQDELAAMQKHVDDWREVEDFDQNSAQRVVDEMNKRHESLMNPKSNPLSTALTSLGFVFHLGLSPASAMVNLSQTALVAYPIMGAKWGFGKTSAALLKASAEAAKGKNDITASLNADERAAYDEAVRAGTIDVTMAHDLAGIAQGEDAGVMWKIRPVMRWASFLFHHAERFNRQVTFVAAYRLAREAGADHKAAFEQATKATYDGHFDYGAANRPRIMQGNVAKVLLLFKQYGQNMVYTLARNAQQAIKGESPEVRAQARKALGGLLATHAAAAGVLGLPMVTTLLAAASMIGGDDDEPWDAKVALQNMLADTLGQKPAEVLAHGLSRLTPWDISGRVGLDRLIFPDVQEGLEGQRLWESAATQALGPVGGIFGGALKGLDLISDGHYKLGLEAMLPAVLRQGVKSIRYATDGAQDKGGVVIKDDVSLAGVAGQLLGFSPSEVRLAQEGKSAIYQHDKALTGRREELLGKAARATRLKDAEARAEAMKEIERFNQKNPKLRITPLNVLQSVRNSQKRIDQAEGGVYLPKNRRDAVDAGRFAVVD